MHVGSNNLAIRTSSAYYCIAPPCPPNPDPPILEIYLTLRDSFELLFILGKRKEGEKGRGEGGGSCLHGGASFLLGGASCFHSGAKVSNLVLGLERKSSSKRD